MTLAIIGMLTWLTTVTVLRIRATAFRSVRWRLYALRDRLRWAAIQDRTRLQSKLFWTLDYVLTAHCANLDEISLWTVLPFFFSRTFRHEARNQGALTERELARPENAALAEVYRESCRTFGYHLLLRHFVLFAILLPTILGVIGLWQAVIAVSKGIVSGAVWSSGRRGPSGATGTPFAGAGAA